MFKNQINWSNEIVKLNVEFSNLFTNETHYIFRITTPTTSIFADLARNVMSIEHVKLSITIYQEENIRKHYDYNRGNVYAHHQ